MPTSGDRDTHKPTPREVLLEDFLKPLRMSANARYFMLMGPTPGKVVAPNKLWVSDITYVPTSTGFLFVAIVLDVFSRRVVGWAMETHLKTQLVLDALNMAVHQRNPVGVIHHSDQGTQYTSIAFGQRCKEAGVIPSMGSVGDCYDNAMCESFNATLECELLVRRHFKNPREAALAVFQFIEGFYNPRRRHTSIGNISPMAFEQRYMDRAA